MGWSGYPGLSYPAAKRAHLEDVTVLDMRPEVSYGREKRFWMLAENLAKEPVIVLVLVDGNAFKEVDESMGPLEYDAPVEWLERAPNPGGPFAAAWREKVYAYWAEKEGQAADKYSTGEENQGYGDSSKVPF